jgi:glycosyltransferase involved in cell wall biosynthesis
MIKIYYPSKKFLTNRETNNAWYPYLLKGFQNLTNVQVIISDDMADLSTSVRGDTISVLEVEIDGKKQRVFYDWADFMVDQKERADQQDAIYCKIQAYGDLIPIGQTVCQMGFLDKLDSLKAIKNSNDYKYDVIGVFRTTNLERRLKAVQIVDDMVDVKSLVGLQKRADTHVFPDKYKMKKMNYYDHLKLQCRSKLCLVFSGVGNKCAFSWRLTEALAMGCAIVTHKHISRLPAHEKFEKNCIITVEPDLSDLEEKINYYLKNEEEREKIAKAGQDYYERYLRPESMATRIIELCMAKQIIKDSK